METPTGVAPGRPFIAAIVIPPLFVAIDGKSLVALRASKASSGRQSEYVS
jgi:hypothetical protein